MQFPREKGGRNSYLMSLMKKKDFRENDFLHQQSNYDADAMCFVSAQSNNIVNEVDPAKYENVLLNT